MFSQIGITTKTLNSIENLTLPVREQIRKMLAEATTTKKKTTKE